MTSFSKDAQVFEISGRKTVQAVAAGAVTTNAPVGLYYGSDGTLYAKTVAADASSVNWGIAEAAISDTATGEIVVKGLATVASGGTAGQLVTAISNAGVITDAAAGATNADINVLGVSASASTFYIY